MIAAFQSRSEYTDIWDSTLATDEGQAIFWLLAGAIAGALLFGAFRALVAVLTALGLPSGLSAIILLFFEDIVKDFGKEIVKDIEDGVISFDDLTRVMHLYEYLRYLEMLKAMYDQQEGEKTLHDEEMHEWLKREIDNVMRSIEEILGRDRLNEEDRSEMSNWWERMFGKSGGKETDFIPDGLLA